MSDEPVSWWNSDALDRERWGALVEPALERLLQARDRDRFPQSVLLVGPAGLGRELAAVETAVFLTCQGMNAPWDRSGCADRVRDGVHPDVQAILPTGAKQIITIAQVRGVVKSAAGRPYEGERRVWIFDGAEAGHFGDQAANAFLKTLEEPPAHAVFILLAANPSAVLPTILSRCQQLALPGVVAVARHVSETADLPELAATRLGDGDLDGAISDIRQALESGIGGETRQLLRLPYLLPDAVPLFSSVAAVALGMAGEAETDPAGEELARLAADLMAVERRSRALNLNSRGQMVSCLLRWYREL
jgi:DNA polymerase-3 subunit delta'